MKSMTTESNKGCRSLIHPGAFDRIAGIGTPIDTCEAPDKLISGAKRVLPLLEACAAAGDEVCLGRFEAAERLWLLLRSVAMGSGGITESSLLGEIAGGTQMRGPRLIHGERLVVLVFATVRAARSPDQATAMLHALRRLLDPLLLLEHGCHALEEAARGNAIPLRALNAALHLRSGDPGRPPVGAGDPGAATWPVDHVWDIFDVPSPDWNGVDVAKIERTISDLWGCPKEAVKYASTIDRFAPRYVIESLSNRWACPGSLVRIHGKNFGPTGRVQFETPDPGDPDYPNDPQVYGVLPQLWTDTLIEVVVPAWARAGELRLLAYETVIEPCLHLDVHRLGNAVQFRGGSPRIYSLTVDDRDFKAFAAPNKPTIVRWHTSKDYNPWGPVFDTTGSLAGGVLTLEIFNVDSPDTPPLRFADLPAGVGSIAWSPPRVFTPTRFKVKLTVSGHCGDSVRELAVLVVARPTLRVEGIEITQGIQNFGLSPGDVRNDLPMVADKDTMVRVYVSANRDDWPFAKLAGVTATLNVDNNLLAPVNTPSPFLELGSLNRRDTNTSFNFRVPAAWCKGSKTLHVHVWGADEIGPLKCDGAVDATWHPKRALPLRYVRVTYNGVATSAQEGRDTALRALEVLPYPATDVAPAWLAEWNTSVANLTTSKGKQTLLDHLHDQHNCTFSEWMFPWEDDCPDDDGATWIGVVPANIGGKSKTGDNTAVAAGVSSDSARMSGAHELGHTLCLLHVNQGCGGTQPDESNKCDSLAKGYASLPIGGLILQVPFDISGNQTVGPSGLVYDFMSYACTTWISPTNWTTLFNKP